MNEITNQEEWNNPKQNLPVFKVDPVMVLIFGILTCGLYLIYWNIKVAEVFNAVAEREIISQPIAIFSGCFILYPFNYRYSRMILLHVLSPNIKYKPYYDNP